MTNVKFFSKYILGVLVLIIFAVIVINNPNFYLFNSDELQAYSIAKQFGLIDIIRLMRGQGHPFIWYMVIKPIPFPENSFPLALKWLSFVFSFIALALLWFKSNFYNWEKILISSTFPMLMLYPILARPYSMSIMFLFILAILYKKRLEHPIWFASLIFITANTSLMATVGAITFGLVFLFDLIKTKNKNIIYPILILTACALILIIQWHNPIMPQFETKGMDLTDFLFLKYSHAPEILKYISIITFPVFLIVSTLYLRNNPRNLFLFWTNTILLMIIFNFLYKGYDYHHYFFYIYWLISYWIQLSEVHKELPKTFVVSFALITILFNASIRNNSFWFSDYNTYHNDILFLNNSVPENSTIYTSIFWHEYFYLFKDKMNFSLKSYVDGSDLFNFENNLNIYNYDYHKLDLETLVNNAPKDSYLLLNDREIAAQGELTDKRDTFIPCNLIRTNNYLIKIK